MLVIDEVWLEVIEEVTEVVIVVDGEVEPELVTVVVADVVAVLDTDVVIVVEVV